MSNVFKFKIPLTLICLLFLITISGCTDLFPGRYEPVGEKDLISVPKSNYLRLQMEKLLESMLVNGKVISIINIVCLRQK